MKRTNLDAAADERLERLLDEELRAAVQATPIDLRAKVLKAIEEAQPAPRRVRSAAHFDFGFTRILRPRWGLAVAAAAVLILSVVVWRMRPVPAELARAPLASTKLSVAPLVEPVIATAEPAVGARSARRARRVFAWDTEPAPSDAAAASTEPYLPGAPAGELGDPLRPMPAPPPINFAPITSAPPVSEYARPVTDFPADSSTPAGAPGTAGPSGGSRR